MCVCFDAFGEGRGETAERQTARCEVRNVLGFGGITLALVHGKIQRGASAARQMRGWESAFLRLLQFKLLSRLKRR